MLKTMAVLRTVYLLFIVGYTIRVMPLFTSVSTTFDEQYARCASSLNMVVRAAWLAVGWIGVETVVGWWMVRRAARSLPLPAETGARPGAGAPQP
jgi:hypothetical protein